MTQGRHSAPGRNTLSSLALITLLTLIGAFLGQMASPSPGHASGGAYSIQWAAADPALNKGTYNPTYPKVGPAGQACPTPSGSAGRAADPLDDAVFYAPPANTAKDAVSSLTPKDMALGQIVPFEMEVTVTSGANGDLRVNPYFLSKTTSGGDFGFDPSYGIICAFVDTSDRLVDPAGNAKVSAFSHTIGNPGTSNEQIEGTIDITGANAGDRFIVEIWVVLDNTIPPGVTGNVQTGLDSASEPSSGDNVNVGNQTVPLLRVQEFFSSEADVQVTKADGPDPVQRGGTLTYTVSVTNNSTDTVANGVVVTDRLDPHTSFVSATGASCSESGGVVTCNVGALAPGATATITITTTVSGSAPTSNDTGSGPKAGFAGANCPGSGVDLCNRVSVSAINSDPDTSNNSYVQPTNVVTAPAPVTPTVTTVASGGGTLGSPTHDTATLSGGPSGGYSGTLTFQLFKNDSCSGSPAFEVTTPVSGGNGSYNSPSVTPTEAGTYYWVAKFTSSTSGVNDSARTACDDAAERVTITAPPPPPEADLEISKTADKTLSEAESSPGQELTYTFEVTNNGPDAAHDVIVRDPLPAGVIFVSADHRCSYAAGVVTCDVGTLASGATVELDVVVKLADAPPMTQSEHAWDVQKVEAFAGLGAGETRDLTLDCPSGYSMMDGTPRVNSVDQGTGGVEDVEFLRSESDPGDAGRFLFKVRNGTGGQAQVHLFAVCVSERTTSVDGHSHGLQLSNPVARTDSFGPGRHQTTLSCPTGTWAVAPGFEWTNGTGSQFKSESSPDGRSWTFGFELDAAGTVESSIRCVDQATTTDAGHREFLSLSHVNEYPSVPPAQAGSSQPYSEHRVSCADDAKGIVATYDLPQGVKQLGSTPEPKIRDFRLLNRSGSTQTARIDLLCLGIRLGSGGERDSITNTATVSGAEADPDLSNNSSTHVLEPDSAPTPGPAPTPVGPGPGETGSASSFGLTSSGPSLLAVEVTCEAADGCADRAKATAIAGKRRASLGSKRFELDAGETIELRFKVSRKAKRKLDRRKPKFVEIDTASGLHSKLRVTR